MDAATLPSDLTFQDKFTFQAPIDAVFAALWAQPGGNLLDVRQIVGAPATVGHQQQARYAYGGVDLLMIETITAATRPTYLQITQQPDGLARHDPVERDIPFLESLTEDLDAAFIQRFGADPAATQIEFSLSEDGQGTQVTIGIAVLTDDRVGWLRKRRWHKKVAAEIADISQRIADRLHVQ